MSEGDLVTEFFEFMRVLIGLATSLVLVALLKLLELGLLLIAYLSQALAGLVQLVTQILNQMRLFLLKLVVVPAVLVQTRF